jgi:hypothetical protein
MADLLKCPKCGAVMVAEDYHRYGWYLDGKRVEGCPPETRPGEPEREDLPGSPVAAAEAQET